MIHLKAFIAGFVSTLMFHQGLLELLYARGISPRAPWKMTPVPPLPIAVRNCIGVAFQQVLRRSEPPLSGIGAGVIRAFFQPPSQDALAQSQRDIALDLVALYKALGGGWRLAGAEALQEGRGGA